MAEATLAGTNRRLLAVALLVSTFLVGMDAVVVSTAMPTIVAQLGGLDLYAWVFSAYLLTSTVTVPLYGKLADLYGRKPLLLTAITVFLVASLLCGQAQTMEQLIFFRVLQGLGAGGIQPLVMTVVGDVFSFEQRARLAGVFSSAWGAAALVGPAVGGLLTEHASWRLAFYVNVPLCMLSGLLVWLFLKERVERRPHQVDYLGAGLLSAAIIALLFGLQLSGPGHSTALTVGLLAAAVVLAALFIWRERVAAEPVLPLSIFRNRVISAGTLMALLLGVVLFGQSAFVPAYVQGVLGASPTVGGFVLSSSSLTWTVCSPLTGRAILRWGYRTTGLIGAGLMLLGSVLLVRLTPDDSLVYTVFVMLLLGSGFSFVSLTALLSAQNAVAWGQRGVVTGLNQFARSIAGTVGVSIAGAVFAASVAGAGLSSDASALLSTTSRAAVSAAEAAHARAALDTGLHAVFLIFLITSILAVGGGFLLPPGHPDMHAARGEDDSATPPQPAPTREPAAVH